MRKRKPVLWLLLISLCLTLAVPALISGLGSFGQLKRLSWLTGIGLLAITLSSWGFNAARVRHLLATLDKKVRRRQSLIIAISAEFAGHATPASSGMPVTFAFLLKDLGLSLGRAMGLVSILMAMDILFFMTVMILAAIWVLADYSLQRTGYLIGMAAAIIIGGLLLLWLVIRHYRQVYHFISRLMARFRWTARRRYRLARTIVEMVHALRRVRQLPKISRLQLAVYTIGYWLPRYLVLIIAVWLVSREVPVAYLFLIQGLLNLGSEVFLLPAGGGGVDALFFGLLSPFLSPANTTFALIVWRAFTFYWYLLIGGPVFLWRTGKAARELLSG